MLNKINRLNKKKEIDEVYKKGKSHFTKFLGIKILANKTKQKRFVIIVSTKVSKLATERNRIKRIIKNEISKKLEQIKEGFDYMIIINPSSNKKERNSLIDNLFYCLKKLNCLKIK